MFALEYFVIVVFRSRGYESWAMADLAAVNAIAVLEGKPPLTPRAVAYEDLR